MRVDRVEPSACNLDIDGNENDGDGDGDGCEPRHVQFAERKVPVNQEGGVAAARGVAVIIVNTSVSKQYCD